MVCDISCEELPERMSSYSDKQIVSTIISGFGEKDF